MLHARKCLAVVVLGLVLNGCSRPEQVHEVGRAVARNRPAPVVHTAVKPRPARPPLLTRIHEQLEALQPMFTTTSSPTTTVSVPLNNVVPPRVEVEPVPVSEHRCGGEIERLIQEIFGPAANWFSSVVWRESRCVPTARNASNSLGLAQLFHHDDLLASVCPQVSPSVSWAIPTCNLEAAHVLYLGSGTRPWSL